MKDSKKYNWNFFSGFLSGVIVTFGLASQFLMGPSDMLRWVVADSIPDKIDRVFSPVNQSYQKKILKIESLNWVSLNKGT